MFSHARSLEADMLLATLHDIVDSETRLCIVGDPCQVKALLKTVRRTSSLHASCGISVSVVDWILDVLLAENMAPSEFVSRVDLLNRHRSSQRCPCLASRAVSVLAPLCLPAPRVCGQAPSTARRSGPISGRGVAYRLFAVILMQGRGKSCRSVRCASAC